MAHAAASILVRDGWVRALGRQLSPASERHRVRLVLVFVLMAAYLLAMVYKGSLVMLLLSAFGAVVQFMPAVLATLYSRRARGGAVLGALLLGSAVTIFFVLQPGLRPAPLHAGLYGLGANLLTLVLGSLASPGEAKDDDLRFLEAAEG